ncbi:hypothetical protein HanIR_Chr08g0358171 [Helianthus annuus]|nr:hypothetical protein HanIR_Chr08g0358171 [Helianthus annuus]
MNPNTVIYAHLEFIEKNDQLKKKKLLQTNYSRQKHKTLSQIKPKSPNKWSIFLFR